MKAIKKYKRIIGISLVLIGLVWYWNCLPKNLFKDPVSTIVKDRKGRLIGARIAADGQWRFPHSEEVPDKFKAAIVLYEDKRYYKHRGVDWRAIMRAVKYNLHQKRIVSGGSTISMQVIRLAGKGKKRTIVRKCYEIMLAFRLEQKYSKEEILALYASNAPFGGNVVGLEAAAWKYYGRNAKNLSWGEMACLAVLPNRPSIMHPGKNRDLLKEKRDWLLDKIADFDLIDSTECFLAKQELLPEKPKALPNEAPHLVDRMLMEQSGAKLIHSTIDLEIQQQVNGIVKQQYNRLKENEIYNIAALVVEVSTGDVLAYTGNAVDAGSKHEGAVDVIPARRSSGSILKPFLYASMLDDGELLPNTILSDVPSHYGSYSPVNYDRSYSGAIAANKALSRSLNIPTVRMLSQHGVTKFHAELKQLGFTTLDRPSSDYGLTLVLGGAEVSLWDLGASYAGIARNLKNFRSYNGMYDPNNFRPLNYDYTASEGTLPPEEFSQLEKYSPLRASSIWYTFEAMQEVIRPGLERDWKNYSSSRKIAWKTGTSFGFRDAWAVGCTPEYVVAVWVGNADGEGRPGIVGIQAAGPVLFDIFNSLEHKESWFDQPFDELVEAPVCRLSGQKASSACNLADTTLIPKVGLKTGLCQYHKVLHLDETKSWQVNSDCYAPMNMVQESFFILPPGEEHYYRKRNPSYRSVPDFMPTCETGNQLQSMEFVYPKQRTKIYLPVGIDGELEQTVFRIAHRKPNTKVYWHLDDTYLGETKHFHEMGLQPKPGKHTITLIDENGMKLSRRFEILAKTLASIE